ncbi:MAG: hypothetical protein ABI390_06925 [Daejeonella sp.]
MPKFTRMQSLSFLIIVTILLAGCQGKQNNTSTTSNIKRSQVLDTVKTLPDTLSPSPASEKLKIALTANALQLVDAVSGSTKEIAFGMPFDQLVPMVGRILAGEPNSVGINTECGAGPLKMATWPNGLTLVFSEKKKGNGEWLFAGWFAGKPSGNGDKPITMAGVGVGSTLEELESAYVTTVTKTTLGQEFAVKSGFYGILSGTGKKAKIDVMWSGTSCNFR